MNQVTVVRMDASPEGIRLRLWMDDERARHIGTGEMVVPASTLAIWWVQVRQEQDRAAQDSLFDV